MQHERVRIVPTMSIYDKLVQNKRAKMLILVLLLAVAGLIGQSESINLTYIVKKEGENLQPNCIAEENERYAAIGWVYPLATTEEQEPNITTKFVPDLANDYNCKFGKRDKCNRIWAVKNWQVDEDSTRTLDLIFDSRWEDFPTILTGKSVKEFNDRIEIPPVLKAAFSLRAVESVELLACEGWNPYNYPCYHFNISKTEIFLRKYMTLPQNISLKDAVLDSYTAFTNILSNDEWRNFILNFSSNGTLSLTDVSVDRTVIQYEDKAPLKPMYLLVRSVQLAVWKMHQNQYFYTKVPQISRLGPTLNLASKELCVALYVTTCDHCAMEFLVVKDGERKVLKTVEPTKESEWRLIKLKDDHILDNKMNIFIETKFTAESKNETEGFWAIDDVRVCHENEVKVTFLKLKNGMHEDDDISCQLIQHPKWRPKKLVYSKIKDFPIINSSSNSTSISLNWSQEDPDNRINYFVTYQANDLCHEQPYFNLRRIKSNGFLMTKHNEITLDNLVPYTLYNITFSSMLHEKEQQMFAKTQEAELPSPEELPNKLQIQVYDTIAAASWEEIRCDDVYGPILYSLMVINQRTNITKGLNVQTENTVKISDLDPFTTYTLKITTSRNFENIQKNKNVVPMTMDFTTQPGIAPPVQQLEVYSSDRTSASLRFDLPKNPRGYPVEIQVNRCYAMKKCKPSKTPIARCALWPKKYCADANYLIPGQQYVLKVSLRNKGTDKYGEEARVDVFASERLPGSPTNLTYKVVDCGDIVDYCHLNVSWLHPYNQNGTISAFHIVLNATDQGTTKDIQEILTIANNSYSSIYEYQIKYIPYSTHYELYVQSVNTEFKSDFVHIHVKTADIGDHIDQSPNITKNGTTSVTVKLPPSDHRLEYYNLTVVVQDFDRNVSVPSYVLTEKIKKHLCHNFGHSWILPQLKITSNSSENLEIGTNDAANPYLKPKTIYCLTFIVTNRYKGTEHDVVYYKKFKTLEDTSGKSKSDAPSQYKHLYMLLLLLLLVPIGFLVYRCIAKKKRRKPKQEENKENMYESLPFEEVEDNCVNNETYDHLIHK